MPKYKDHEISRIDFNLSALAGMAMRYFVFDPYLPSHSDPVPRHIVNILLSFSVLLIATGRCGNKENPKTDKEQYRLNLGTVFALGFSLCSSLDTLYLMGTFISKIATGHSQFSSHMRFQR